MLLNFVVATLVVSRLCAQSIPYVVPVAELNPTNYQKWAHYHWVWLHNGQSNQDNTTALLKGYKDHNIPVGAVNIDSTWATEFNNFVVNTNKFHDFSGLLREIHDQHIKVTLWVTSMINVENPDFNMTVKNDYLIKDSHGIARPMKWWHGYGALLDYTNPEALAWWHTQMDKVLDVGVDGFKCDATDPYIMEYSLTGGAFGYGNKQIKYHEYANSYYRDFLYHTRERRSLLTGPDSGLIMSRPVDCFIDPVTKGCLPQSPRDVMFSGWVGDDDATFNGLRGCLRKLIYSSWMNYANFGCDVGGYRGTNPSDKTVFLRWAQAMAFMPLMENGGGGEHRPWMYDEETVDIYRKYVVEHHKLAAYLHTTGANAVDSTKSSIIPVDFQNITYNEAIDEEKVFPQPTSYTYRLGNDILVHPVLWDVNNATEAAWVQQEFPFVGSDATTYWLDYWHPHNKDKVHKSGDTGKAVLALGDYSVYVRQGALIPILQQANVLVDSSDVTNKRVVFTWYAPTSTANSDNKAVYSMRESITEGSGMVATAYFATETTVEISISAHKKSTFSSSESPKVEDHGVGFEIVGIHKPTAVTFTAWPTSLCTHVYVDLTNTLTVNCLHNEGGVLIHLEGVTSSMF